MQQGTETRETQAGWPPARTERRRLPQASSDSSVATWLSLGDWWGRRTEAEK